MTVIYRTEEGWVVRSDTSYSAVKTREEAVNLCNMLGVEFQDISESVHSVKKKRKKRDKES